MDKAYVEWDCLLVDETSSGEFLLCPKKDAVGGIRMVPPKGYGSILRGLDRFTPVRVKGRLVYYFNGLHLESTSLDLRNLTKPNHVSESPPNAVH